MPKNRFVRTAAFAAMLLPAAGLLAETSVQELMKTRHDGYHQLGDAFKTVNDESRARRPDVEKIRNAVSVVQDVSVKQFDWFPKGTGPEAGKTRALPEIWSKPSEFAAAQKLFADAAPRLQTAAQAGDVKAIREAFGEVGKTCRNCHENFRGPEHD